MSLAEIKQEIEHLTPSECEELRRLLAIKSLQDRSDWPDEMDRRIERVKAGHFATKEDLERIHAQRVAEGR